MVTSRDRKSFGSRRKIPNLLRWLAPLMLLYLRSGISGPTWRRASACQNLHEWWIQTAHVEMPSRSAIDLAEIRRSSKIISWIWSIISRVVTVLGRPGRCATQVQRSPRLNRATQFLTVAYHGAYFPNVSNRMAWIFFGALPCRKKNLDDSSRLDVVEIVRVTWYASFQPL